MRSLKHIMYEPLICLVLSGCATPGTSGYRYEPPSQPPFENERIIEAPFSDVWDKMVGQLAKSFFVINNVEKASRIINVSFSSDAPEKYLDCGMSHRTFEEGDTATKYDYATAEASTYLVAGKWGNFDNLPSTASLRRTTTVEGRANIYVAPKEDKTIVTVNVRYIFGVKVEGVAEYKNGVGTVVQRTAIPSTSNTLSFNTGEIGSANWNGVTVKCASKGTLESQVLRLNSQ